MPGYETSTRVLGSTNKETARKGENLLWVSSRGGVETELRGMSSIISSRLTVSNSPTALPPSRLENRKSLGIYVPGTMSGTFYIGGPGLNEDNGFPIPAGEYMFLDAEGEVYGYCTEEVNVRLVEGA